MEEKDYQDIAYLILAVVGIVAAKKVWDSKIKPLIGEQLTQLGVTSQQDIVGVALVALPVLIALFVVRHRIKKAAERRALRKEVEKRRKVQEMARDFDEF